MPYPSSLSPNSTQTADPTPLVPVNSTPAASDSAVAGFLFLAVVIGLTCGFFSYQKYRVAQRSRLLKRQVAMLEAMWRISSAKRKF